MSDAYLQPPKPLMTRAEVRQFLNDNGFPIGESTFDKACMPSAYKGPAVEAWFGSRPLYNPDRALEWAKSRLTKTRTFKS